MLKKPKLSVIVVAWNRCLFTKNCLEALIYTTRNVDREIIVVNNGSEDDTAKMLKKYKGVVKVITNKTNKGFGKAYNKAMSLVTGEYVLCLDNDIVLLEGWADRVWELYEKYPKLGQLGLLNNPFFGTKVTEDLDFGAKTVAGAWVAPYEVIKDIKWCEKMWKDVPWQAVLMTKAIQEKGFKTANVLVKWIVDLSINNHKLHEDYYRKTFKDRNIVGKLELMLREEAEAVKNEKIHLVEPTGKPKVELSIITVNWNGLEYLKKCVDAIVKNTTDFELIIVDNNSNQEGTESYLKEIESENIKVVMLDQNTGWVGGVNKGLEFAEGEYICFMNNDIEVKEDWFGQMKTHFNFSKEDNTGMVGPVSDFTMGWQKASLNPQVQGNHHQIDFLIGWLLLTKREVLYKVAEMENNPELQVNGMACLDPIFGLGSSDDLDLSLRVRKAGYNLFIAREVYVIHHGSKSYQKMFGEDLYKSGTEANKNYMADVDAKIKILRNKWGNEEIDKLLGIPKDVPKPQFRGTIGIPHGELIPHRFHTDLLSLQGINDVKIAHIYGSLIMKARNDLVKEMSGDWMLFIDSDMTFPPDALNRLLKHLEREDVDIVAGIFTRKVPKYEPCFFKKLPDHTPGYMHILDWDKENLFEVDGVGSAFTLIKRKVFEKIPYPWYEYTNYISEDLNFCRKAKDYGFKVWIDPTLKIGHLVMLPITIDVWSQDNAELIKKYKEDALSTGKDPVSEEYKKQMGILQK